MALKHIGFAIEDNDGDYVLDEYENLLFAFQHDHLVDHVELSNSECSDFAPHKIVRVLIDDEV